MRKGFILSIVFIFLGFLGAYFIFQFFTRTKHESPILGLALSAKQRPSEAKPIEEPQQHPDSAQREIVSKDSVQGQSGKDDEVAKKEIPDLILNGIFSSETGNFALINNRILKEGDLISGARVLRIYSEKVELDVDGQEITLRVK